MVEKLVTANRVVSVVVTSTFFPENTSSLSTVTTAAEGLATVNPDIALIAVYKLSATVSLPSFDLTKCLLPIDALGLLPPAVSNSTVIIVPSLFLNIILVPTGIFA